jgi:hypothetical protein
VSLKDWLFEQVVEPRTVQLPHWPEKVELRALNVSDFGSDRWSGLVKVAGQATALIVMSTYDANGDPVFNDEDASKVAAMPAVLVTELSKELSKLNGLGQDGIEDVAKNSCGSPGVSSS